MAKTTPNKKKHPAEVETLRETLAKTKSTEKAEAPKHEAKASEAKPVEKTETKTETKVETKTVEVHEGAKAEKSEKRAEVKTEKKTDAAVLDVDDLTGALENHKTRKKPLMTALIALLTVLVVVGLTFWFLYWGANRQNNQEEQKPSDDNSQVEEKPEDPDEIEVIEGVDYVQDIVGANGVALEPVYYLGTKDNFTLKFAKLNCDETCSNIDEVKIGGKLLTSGQDYVVKREDGVTIVIYAAALNKYAAGNEELTFRILQNKDGHKELRTVGVKFEIKKAIVCGEGQVVQNGQCVNKDEANKPSEKPDSEQAKCEAQEGPDYVYQVHWYTDDERQEVIKDYGYDSSVIVSVVRGDFVGDKDGETAAGMKLINGVCRPNPNATAVTSGEKSYTEANLSSVDNTFAALVMGNPQQDILVYAWRTDNGAVNYRMEVLR